MKVDSLKQKGSLENAHLWHSELYHKREATDVYHTSCRTEEAKTLLGIKFYCFKCNRYVLPDKKHEARDTRILTTLQFEQFEHEIKTISGLQTKVANVTSVSQIDNKRP